jgi:hypothetical protein
MMTRAKRHTYDSGLPFGKKLGENLKDQVERVAGNKASMIVIDGQVGEGKTTLAVQCADFIQGSPIDLKIQLAMGGGDFTSKMKICYAAKKIVIIYDEAGDFNKRGSLTKFNAMLNRIFETFRTFKIIVILCLPSLNVLDNTLFDKGIVRLVIHCYDRDNYYGRYKGFSLYRAFYIREFMKKNVVKPQAYIRTGANFYGCFLDLPPERSRELDKISTEGKLNILDEGEIIYHGLLTIADISIQLEQSVTWVELELKKLSIKPVKRFKRRKYYDPVVVETLSPLAAKSKVRKKKEIDDAD